MDDSIGGVGNIYSSGERFEEMWMYTDRRLKTWEEEVAALFPLKAGIPDIGCGKGREAFCLNEKGFRVTGIDISETAISAAKQVSVENDLGMDFLVTDGTSSFFPDARFDAIVIRAQIFELFHAEEGRQRILAECKRVFVRGGVLSFQAMTGIFSNSITRNL